MGELAAAHAERKGLNDHLADRAGEVRLLADPLAQSRTQFEHSSCGRWNSARASAWRMWRRSPGSRRRRGCCDRPAGAPRGRADQRDAAGTGPLAVRVRRGACHCCALQVLADNIALSASALEAGVMRVYVKEGRVV